MNMSISEFLLHTTIRIETTVPGGISTGTGFFFNFCEDKAAGEHIPVIVTNKHVIKDSITGTLCFSSIDSSNQNKEHILITIDNFESQWILHPKQNIDLAILPIANLCKQAENSHKQLLRAALSKSYIPNQQEIIASFSNIEDITVIGYPDGIWDFHNNKPIVRKGITATALQYNFQNKPIFLIDAAIFPGSSGSPVFIFNEGYYYQNNALIPGSRLKLVGIVYATAQHSISGDLKIVDIPATKTVKAESKIPNNLGVAIHARELLAFESILKNIDC